MFMKGAPSLWICRVNVNLTEEGTIVQEDARAAAEDDRKITMPSVLSRCNDSAVKEKGNGTYCRKRPFAKYEYPLGDARLSWLHDVKSMFMKGALSLGICRVNVDLTEEGTVVQEDAMAAAEDDAA
ncbi:hypothetical protein CDAR_430421 [Caerostris darwini]|uniref:Uncharacterized protein n=1 Tax=Caerostris darwini TaxID=1538125 RepID=A0AAV4SML7_9ARAC|nr:hypothetical protein CDAR_430421 [Caerostris darwini]